MATECRILAFAGSTRAASFNKRLVRIAAAGASAAGAEVTVIDLRDHPLPLYDGDLEAEHGLPDEARALRQLFREHHGLLISAPEYNSGMTAVLKNTLDWVSRQGDDPGPSPYAGKVAAVMAASPGALGGLRGLFQVRPILTTLGVLVIPEQRAVGRAGQAFDDQDNLVDADQQAAVEALGARVADLVRRLAP